MDNNRWIQIWGQTYIPLSLFHYPEKKRTLRLVINSAICGNGIKIRLSNAYGKNNVEIKSITVARCDENGRAKSNDDVLRCKYRGKESFNLYKGEQKNLDEVQIEIDKNSYICISIYVEKGDLSSGNLMNNATLLTCDGDMSKNLYFTNKKRTRDSIIALAQKLIKIPLPKPIPLFESVEICNNDKASSIVVLGDSLSQQGYWTNEFDKRLRNERYGEYTLINKSAMGNRIIRDCSPKFILKNFYGIKAIDRIENDVLSYDNVSYCLLFIGINDIIQYATLDAYKSKKPDLNELCNGILKMTEMLHKKGIKVIMFTLIPFGAAANASKEKDELRRKVNEWIRTNESKFDGVLDVDKALADKNDDYYVCPKYLGGDKMHINAAGGKIISDLIDINFFK